jgi:tetratricopeptide (TPR) repeat protein
MASIYLDQKEYSKSIESANKSIKANNNYPMGHYILAKVLYISDESFNYTALSELLNRSIELNMNNSQAYELLALVEYEENKDIEIAQKHIQQAIDRVDTDILFMDSERSYHKMNFFNQY